MIEDIPSLLGITPPPKYVEKIKEQVQGELSDCYMSVVPAGLISDVQDAMVMDRMLQYEGVLDRRQTQAKLHKYQQQISKWISDSNTHILHPSFFVTVEKPPEKDPKEMFEFKFRYSKASPDFIIAGLSILLGSQPKVTVVDSFPIDGKHFRGNEYKWMGEIIDGWLLSRVKVMPFERSKITVVMCHTHEYDAIELLSEWSKFNWFRRIG